MKEDKIIRFADSQSFFSCPVCLAPLYFKNNSLLCSNRHCFDISKHGYVNLILNGKSDETYSKESFVNRKLVLDNGFYSHILANILSIIHGLDNVQTVLDVGCGEGYYSRKLIEASNKNVLAFDISKDSIHIAAKQDKSFKGKWFVSDLAHLTIQNQAVDCILDIFSPANYGEFQRVLRDGGYIIKVIPTACHLKELREKASAHLLQKNYSNESVLSYFCEHFSLITKTEVTKTFDVSPAERDIFINMTPLLFNVDKEKINWSDVTSLTVSALVLLGKKTDDR